MYAGSDEPMPYLIVFSHRSTKKSSIFFNFFRCFFRKDVKKPVPFSETDFFSSLFVRELSQDNGCKHHHTAQDFPAGQSLTQKHPARQHRDHGFQAEDQRGHCGIHLLLSDDLQCITDPAGKNSGIKDRQPGRTNRSCLRFFKKKHRDRRKDSADHGTGYRKASLHPPLVKSDQ